MKWNVLSSLILTLMAVDKLFNLVLFLVGVLFNISVTGHHHLSLIPFLLSPAVLTEPRLFSPTPSGHYPSPAALCSLPHFVNTCPTRLVNNCRLCPPHCPYPYPTVFYRPPRNSGGPATSAAVRISRQYHVCLTILRTA